MRPEPQFNLPFKSQDPFLTVIFNSFPGGPDYKASACNAGDSGLIPGLGRSPGEGTSNPL